MIFAGTKRSFKRFSSLEEEFKLVHNNKYNYDASIYYGFKKDIAILCQAHGEFNIQAKRHIEGQGCPICKDIDIYGHLKVSKTNFESHPQIIKEYLTNKYPNLFFDNFQISDVFIFECKLHGQIESNKIKCDICSIENKENKKLKTIKKLLSKRTEKIVSVEYGKVVLKCEHGTYEYNNKQLYGGVFICEACRNKPDNSISQEEFINRAIDRIGDVYDIKNTSYKDAKTKIKLNCEKHGEFYLLPSNFFKGQGCNKCSHVTSKAEQEISYLDESFETNDRKFISPKELDVISHKYKIAIEYNGLMWHSIGKSQSSKFDNINCEKTKNIHLTKSNLVEENGYQLFHIFENEWLDETKRNIWKSVIFNSLHKNKRIYARKCLVKEISNKEVNEFLENNHLQGSALSKVKLGLYFNNELVSIMTFGKSRFNKSFEYELIRFSSKMGVSVVGGASKLLSYFEKTYNPKSIISYANRRWSKGNLYEKLGFTFVRNTPPNYFYFKPNENILFSRNIFQKHKLSKILNKFDVQLTESENMYNNGYRKIYDCGNKVYIKEYK